MAFATEAILIWMVIKPPSGRPFSSFTRCLIEENALLQICGIISSYYMHKVPKYALLNSNTLLDQGSSVPALRTCSYTRLSIYFQTKFRRNQVFPSSSFFFMSMFQENKEQKDDMPVIYNVP